MKKKNINVGFIAFAIVMVALAAPLNTAFALIDSDADTIANHLDTDSDNDGILDVVENNYDFVDITPEMFGQADIDETLSTFSTASPQDISSQWGLPAGSILLSITNAGSTTSPTGSYLWSTTTGQLVTFTLSGTMKAELHLLHGSALDGAGEYDGFISNDGAIFNPTHTLETGYSDLVSGNDYRVVADGSEDGANTGSFRWASDGPASSVSFSTTNTATWGNAVTFSVMPLLDTDGDTVPNKLDLDSDNDGIPDLVEATASTPQPFTNGRYNGSSDANGQPGVLSGTAIDPVDTDNDGTPDFLDLDTDNDGIPDALEARTTATYVNITHVNNATNNGVNDTGIVSVPTNTDGDANPDFRDLDSDGDSLTDTSEITAKLVPTYQNVDASTLTSALRNTFNSTTPEVDFREPDMPPTIDLAALVKPSKDNVSAYPLTGTCTAVGDSISITIKDQNNKTVTVTTTCGAGGTFSATADVSGLDYNATLSATATITDGVHPAVSDVEGVSVQLANTGTSAVLPAATGLVAIAGSGLFGLRRFARRR